MRPCTVFVASLASATLVLIGCNEPLGSERTTELATQCLAEHTEWLCAAVAEGQPHPCVSFESIASAPSSDGGTTVSSETVCMLLCDVTVPSLACPKGSSCEELGIGRQTANPQTGCVPD